MNWDRKPRGTDLIEPETEKETQGLRVVRKQYGAIWRTVDDDGPRGSRALLEKVFKLR